jgi:hypothetical protein
MFDFQYYHRINTAKPGGFTNINGFISDLQSCKYKGIPKSELPYCTPCAIFRYRNYDNIIRYTGLMAVDIDHVDNASETRDWLFESYPETVIAFISPGRKGVRGLIKIPIVSTIDEYKELFWGLFSELKSDTSMQKPTQPFFYSHDADIKWRNYENCPEWTTTGISPLPKYDPLPVTHITEAKDFNKKRIRGIFRNRIQRIGKNDPRHPQIIEMSIYMSGFVKSGYLSAMEANSLLWELINSNEWIREGSIKQYKIDIEQGISWGLLNRNAICLR